MKVSVCVPTYNSAAYIGDCLKSVLSQESVDFEIIVFDNASQDGTWEIVKSMSEPRLKTFRSDHNCGMAINFNRALLEAKGEYVKLLCSDDLLEPTALVLQTNFLDDHHDIPMVTCATQLVDSDEHLFATVQRFARPVIIDSMNLRAMSLIYGNVVGEPSAVLFRRESWHRAGPFREGLVTLIDLDMWFRLSRQGGVGYLPLPLCRIRRHSRSMTNQFRGAGEVQGAALRLTEESLNELKASTLVRKVCLGRVAGSHVRHALYGLRHGSIRWPAAALAKAFHIDPGFVGLFLYLTLFRTGVIGLRVDKDGKTSVGSTGTLTHVAEA